MSKSRVFNQDAVIINKDDTLASLNQKNLRKDLNDQKNNVLHSVIIGGNSIRHEN